MTNAISRSLSSFGLDPIYRSYSHHYPSYYDAAAAASSHSHHAHTFGYNDINDEPDPALYMSRMVKLRPKIQFVLKGRPKNKNEAGIRELLLVLAPLAAIPIIGSHALTTFTTLFATGAFAGAGGAAATGRRRRKREVRDQLLYGYNPTDHSEQIYARMQDYINQQQRRQDPSAAQVPPDQVIQRRSGEQSWSRPVQWESSNAPRYLSEKKTEFDDPLSLPSYNSLTGNSHQEANGFVETQPGSGQYGSGGVGRRYGMQGHGMPATVQSVSTLVSVLDGPPLSRRDKMVREHQEAYIQQVAAAGRPEIGNLTARMFEIKDEDLNLSGGSAGAGDQFKRSFLGPEQMTTTAFSTTTNGPEGGATTATTVNNSFYELKPVQATNRTYEMVAQETKPLYESNGMIESQMGGPRPTRRQNVGFLPPDYEFNVPHATTPRTTPPPTQPVVTQRAPQENPSVKIEEDADNSWIPSYIISGAKGGGGGGGSRSVTFPDSGVRGHRGPVPARSLDKVRVNLLSLLRLVFNLSPDF